MIIEKLKNFILTNLITFYKVIISFTYFLNYHFFILKFNFFFKAINIKETKKFLFCINKEGFHIYNKQTKKYLLIWSVLFNRFLFLIILNLFCIDYTIAYCMDDLPQPEAEQKVEEDSIFGFTAETFRQPKIHNIYEPWSKYGIDPIQAKAKLENVYSDFSSVQYKFLGVNEAINPFIINRVSYDNIDLSFLKHQAWILAENALDFEQTVETIRTPCYNEIRYKSLEYDVFKDMLRRTEEMLRNQDDFLKTGLWVKKDFNSFNQYSSFMSPIQKKIDLMILSYNLNNPTIEDLRSNESLKFDEEGIITEDSWANVCTTFHLLDENNPRQ